MVNTVVSQHTIQIADDGDDSNCLVSQHTIQVAMGAPAGLKFEDINCTDICSEDTQLSLTEDGLSWAILDNSDASLVTSILGQGNNLNVTDGEGFITIDLSPGIYIVIVQSTSGSGSIAAYERTTS